MSHILNFWDSLVHFIKNDRSPESQIKWSLYLRVWREFGLPYWPLLLTGVICTIIAAGAEGFAITLVKDVIDQGFIEKNMDSLYVIGLELIGAYTAKSFFSYSKVVVMAKAGMTGATQLRRRMFRKLMTLSQDFFATERTGLIVNRFTSLADAMMALVTDNVISVVQNISTMVIMLSLMFWYAPQITMLLMFLAPAIIVTVVVLTRKRRVVVRRTFTYNAESLTLINEAILGVKTIQSFTAEGQQYQRMCVNEDKRVKMGMKAARITGLQTPVLEIFISIGLCGALLVGGHFITGGSITTGDFTAFLLALSAAYKPTKTLTNLSGGIQMGLIAAEGLFNLLDREPTIRDWPGARDYPGGPASVEFRNVFFAYKKADGDVIHDLRLKVHPGQVCALVGRSGGGKTTIFSLLQRFFDPRRGRVIINGTDLRDITLHSLRHSISVVSQDVFLFNGSVADNIRFGTPEATDEEVIKAAKAAYAHDFIMEMPEQYQSSVGERGQLLSGGQRQRIAIARAILKNAPILLLDEATSALDSNAEHLIQEALRGLMKGRTTFVIAHRLSTVNDADVICVIQNGRITEKGTDAQLYALGGEYKYLKDLQFKKAADSAKAAASKKKPQK